MERLELFSYNIIFNLSATPCFVKNPLLIRQQLSVILLFFTHGSCNICLYLLSSQSSLLLLLSITSSKMNYMNGHL